MSLPLASLLSAPVRVGLKGLRLQARHAPGGQGIGQHSSRSRGAGLEFAQYRAYEPGDELRRIDWKLYARSDRYFVRDAERDSPLTVWTLIDTTASMNQADATRPALRRLDAAKGLAACIAELALQQGDAFGLAAVGGAGLSLLPAGGGVRHRDRLWRELETLSAGGQWPADARLLPLWERIAAPSLVILLTDGFEEQLLQLAERLAAARREVLMIQLLTAEERDFPYSGGQRFRDPETGEELRVDAVAAREDFLARFAEARAALGRRLAGAGIRHVDYVLDQSLDQPLRQLFGRRDASMPR